MVKNPPADVGNEGLIPRPRRSSGGGNDKPLQSVFWPEKSHGQWILLGYSPWGHKRVGHD